MMTINDWLDINMNLLYGKKVRVINAETHKGVGDMMILYMDKPVRGFKVTDKFLFIFI